MENTVAAAQIKPIITPIIHPFKDQLPMYILESPIPNAKQKNKGQHIQDMVE